jgi:hypothetical protein
VSRISSLLPIVRREEEQFIFPYICVVLRCFKYARARVGRRKETDKHMEIEYAYVNSVLRMCMCVNGNSSYVLTTTLTSISSIMYMLTGVTVGLGSTH